MEPQQPVAKSKANLMQGSVLENYSFDVRDFTDAQLTTLNYASTVRFGNKELRSRLLSAIRSQGLLRDKYFKRVSQARAEAYARHLRYKNAMKIGVPVSVVSTYENILEKSKKMLQSLLPSKVSIYSKVCWFLYKLVFSVYCSSSLRAPCYISFDRIYWLSSNDKGLIFQDSMQWPDIRVNPEDIQKPHITAGMPPDCVGTDGFERLKEAFLPKQFRRHFNPDNPTHTFNRDALM